MTLPLKIQAKSSSQTSQRSPVLSGWETLPDLAAVLDCFDGSIQGSYMDNNMRTELCVQALENASRNTDIEGAILHSDRGSQFTSQVFLTALRRHKLIQSMSGTGRCCDNARMESFFATLKKEELYQIDTTRMSRDEVKSVVFRPC